MIFFGIFFAINSPINAPKTAKTDSASHAPINVPKNDSEVDANTTVMIWVLSPISIKIIASKPMKNEFFVLDSIFDVLISSNSELPSALFPFFRVLSACLIKGTTCNNPNIMNTQAATHTKRFKSRNSVKIEEIIPPKNTIIANPIVAPSANFFGECFWVASVMMINCVLSPNSAKKIIPKAVNIADNDSIATNIHNFIFVKDDYSKSLIK